MADTCGLTACTPGSAPGPTLVNEYGKPLPFYRQKSNVTIAASEVRPANRFLGIAQSALPYRLHAHSRIVVRTCVYRPTVAQIDDKITETMRVLETVYWFLAAQ